MSFIKDILNISESFSGILFEANKIKIIKLKKESENFFPVYWDSMDFDLDNLLQKSEMIKLFKKIKLDLKTEKINFDLIHENKKSIEKEIISNLKIAGFQEINLINWDYNLNNLIINEKNLERNIFAFSSDGINIEINYVEENHIYKKEVIKITDLDNEKVKYFIDQIDNNHIFLSGYFKDNLDHIRNIFYKLGVKVHIFNIWENILSFEKNIPSLLKNESHEYIKAISLALPPQKTIKFIREKVVSQRAKKEKKETTEEIDIDFIIDNQKETTIISERGTFWQKIKDFFNRTIWGPKKSKSFQYFHDEKSILNKEIKTFLPKPKEKLFLPKLKNNKPKEKISKNKNINKNKIFLDNKYSFKLVNNKKEIIGWKKMLRKPGKYKSFIYYHDENSILHKEIKDIKFNLIKNKKQKIEKSILLKKPEKKIFLPKTKVKSLWEKIVTFLNRPIFEKEKKRK